MALVVVLFVSTTMFLSVPNVTENGRSVLECFTTSTHKYKGKAHNKQLRKSASIDER
jgi:competence protein ComGC